MFQARLQPLRNRVFDNRASDVIDAINATDVDLTGKQMSSY